MHAPEGVSIRYRRRQRTAPRPPCLRRTPALSEEVTEAMNGQDFLWPQGFRNHLCICPMCVKLYETCGYLFLIDIYRVETIAPEELEPSTQA